MSTANDVLDFKGHDLWTIDANSTVHEATQLMEDPGSGALPASEGGSPLAGVLSERTARAPRYCAGCPPTRRRSHTMTREVIALDVTTLVDKCMYLMSHHDIRHLPVKDGRELIGIMSGSDVMRFVVLEQNMTIEALHSFIHEDEGGEG